MATTRVFLQFDLFGGAPARMVDVPLPPPPEPPRDPIEEVPVLPGQLDLLGARSTRLAPVRALAADGRFADAATLSRTLPREDALAATLDALAKLLVDHGTAEALLSSRHEEFSSTADSPGSGPIAESIGLGIRAEVARRVEAVGPGARAAGRIAAFHWFEARRFDDARESCSRTIASGLGVGDGWALLGRCRWKEGDVAGAREAWLTALVLDPEARGLDDIDDEEVLALCGDALEFELPHGWAWAPVLGLLRGVFGPSPLPPGASAPERFRGALQRSREASRRGKVDIEARRELKQGAPLLFEACRDAGLV